MKSRKATLIQLLKRNLATVLIMVLLPIIPIQIAKAENLSISIGSAIEGQKISFSWNSITNAVRYEYSVRDLTTNELLISHEETTKTSGSIPASYVIKDHQYKVWVGAFYEVAEDNMPEAIANSYITECAKKEKSTLYGTTYEQYNDTYHKRYDVYDITCKVCGDHIEYRNETTKEKHTMKNGKCTVCGYEEEPDPLDVVVSRNQANAQVGDSIGATAEITGGSGSYLRDWTVTCDGETITTSSNNESEFNWIATKAGSWKFKITVLDNNTGEKVSDTSSAITVTEAECTHENTTETLIDTEYIQKNEDHHTVRNYYRITCSNPSCGAILNPSYYKDTDEAHTFGADGKCEKCGYVPPTEECDHENITSELLRTELRQCDSDNNHYSVAIYKDVCADCGVTVKEEREVITLVPHEFVNGVCACGFAEPTPECDHATTRDKISTVLEQYSDTVHRMVITYHVYCDCGQVDYEEEIESFPEHQFDSNGLCECGYKKVEETSVSFTVDKTTVTVGENVTFTITTNVATVDFVADGTAYNTVTVTGGSATYVRAFTEQGDRQIKFVAPDGTSSDIKTIHVTSKGQLDQATISVPSSVEEGNSVTASWTAVDHAENYIVRLYDDVPTELWKQETTGTSVTIPASLLEADKHYTVSVIATGTDYTQSESSAGFAVTAQATIVSFTVDKTTVTVGEDVTFTITTNAATVDFVADGTAYNTVAVTGGSATYVRAFTEQGDRQIKFVAPDGTSSDTKTIHVTAKGQLDQTTISVPTSVEEGNSVTASWTAVDHAENYVVRLYDDVPTELWKQETSGTSVTIPANLLEADKHYTVSVIATGTDYTQSESSAGFVVTAQATTVSFTVDKTEATVGENVTFTITTNAASVDFVANGTAYNTVTVTGGSATYVRAFTEQGNRQVKFVAPDGTSSDTKTIHVTSKGQLDQTTISVPASVEEGNSVSASWTAVDHAENYVVRLYDDVPTELWKQETTSTSVTIPASLLEADKHYTVSVIATGTDYTQSESSAGFVVNAKQKEIVIDGAFGQDGYTITVGETLDVAVSASAQNANLTRVTIKVDGTDNNRLSSKEISGTNWNGALTLDGAAAPLNVPGTYTIKLFVGVDAGDPNWAEVDQATLKVVEPEKEIVIDGAFGQKNYTMTMGETLDVDVSASAQNANLTRVTINMDGGGYDKEISGTSWNGAITLNSTFAPLNAPGTYTIKLIVGVDAGNPNWAEVDQATLTINAPEEEDQKLPDPVITSPSAGDVLESTTFTLSWNAVNGADHYVYTASDLSQDAVKVVPVTATNDLAVELTLPEKGHNYRAAVGAVPADVNDNEADKISWSTVEFSVQSEPKALPDPTITYPANGAVLDTTSVTVSWNDVDGAVDFAISVYDITSDKRIADCELTGYAFSAVINDLEWFHQYRVAVGAVPRKANGDSTKYSWSTVEFSVARAFIGTPTLEATGYYSVNGDPTYRVTAITDGHITRLSGVNDTGTPLNETWDKTTNADGTITWVRVYTPGMSANNRTWTLTAWVGDQQIEQATTNAASMHVHTFGAKKYKDAHPHQYYQVCTVCNHELLLSNQYYTANGTVQDPAVCCVCHGHQYGDAYEENGAWYQKCSKCGKIMTATNIPITASDETIYDFDATKSILIARLNDNWAGYGDKVFGEAYRTWTQGFMAIDLYIADVGGNLDFIKIATDVVNLIWEQGEQGINKAVDLLNGLGIDIDRAILQEIYQSIRETTAENLHPIFAGLTRDEIKLIAEILDESTEKALSDVKKNTKVVNDNLKAINSVVKELNEQLPDSETGIKEETLYDVYDKIMDFIDANTGKEIFVDGVHRSGLNEKMASMLENVLDGERVDFLDRANFEKWLEKIKGTEKGLKIIGKIVKVGKIVVNEAVYQETLLSFSDIQQAQIEIAKNATNDARLKTALSQLQKQISDHTYSIIKNSTDSSIDFLLDELADYALKLNPYTGIAKFVLQVVNAITPNVQKKFDAIKEFTKMYDLTVAVKNAAIEKITNMPQNPTQEDLNDLRLYLDTYISYMKKLSVKYDAMLSFNNEKNNAPQNISMDNFKQMIDAILNTYQIGGIE